MESGGDNLTATFSSGLIDVQIFVIDVAGGDKVPRKGGPGVTYSDLLVVNKTDLAPLVGADLDVMRRDAATVRGDRPTVLISLTEDPAAGPVLAWVREQLRVAQASRCGPTSSSSRCPGRRPRIECTGGLAARRTPNPTPCTWCRRRPRRSAATRSRCASSSKPGARLRVRTAAATVALPGAATR